MAASFDPLGLSRSGWEAAAEGLGLPRFRGRQIFDALHLGRRRSWEAITVLPASLRERLSGEAPLRLPEIVRREESADGSRKYGLRLSDGALIEAVLMPGEASAAAVNEFEDARAVVSGRGSGIREQGSGKAPGRRRREPGSERYTVCLSSQTGCAVDCVFCVTGRLGGGRNLTAGEIVGQLYAVQDDAGLATEGLRVVFMGMGEPFLNPDGVIGALEILLEVISPRRVTVSTSGITPAFARFAALPRRPNLAVSINAADEQTRTRIMPINQTYPLDGVLRAMRAWPLESRRRITAEYVLIAGVNDSAEDARRLARKLKGMAVKVNVIPLNEDPVYLPGWKRPEEAAIDSFAKTLAGAGATVTVRRSRGPDARAACGQLKGRTQDVRKRVISSQSSVHSSGTKN
ncbi:MAG: 23S rRNA (adenine(2503)-C(2))-methyltransferase RlmN [Acidobacteriota bacterium]